MKSLFLLIAVLASASAHGSGLSDTERLIQAGETRYESIYQDLHRHPELSQKEEKTSAFLAAEMEKLGFTVTRGVGGYGIVAVLQNGPGPTAMVRTEMDALPVQEDTGLPYSSTVPGVMHACGHDMHMAIWLGTADVLVKSKDRWSGTLVMIGQPAEETLTGAKAMIDDGLFTRFPKPDYVLGLHVIGGSLKGQFFMRSGYIQAAADFFYVKLNGRGTHGALPHRGISPIELLAEFQAKLNSVLALEVDPLEPAILDIGRVTIGTKGNIIPPYGELEGSIRTFDPAVRTYLKTRLVEIANGIALVNNAPAPEVKWNGSTNPNYNDPQLHAILYPLLSDALGTVFESTKVMASEDFSEFAPGAGIPSYFFQVGTAESLPTNDINHSPKYAPVFHPAYEVGVKAMVESVIKLQSQRSVERERLR